MEDRRQTLPFPTTLPPIVVMVVSPAMGQIFPFTEFAKRLLRHHNLPVTILITNIGDPPSKAQTSVLNSLPHGISHVFLPPVTDLSPSNTKVIPFMTLMLLRSLPSIRHTLLSLMKSHRVAALLVHFFAADAFHLAAQLNIPSYLFFTSTAMLLSFSFYFPQGELMKDLSKPVRIPGCVPVHGKDLVDWVQNRNDDDYKGFLHLSNLYRSAEGIIINTFTELEPGAIELLQKDERVPPVYPVGPLVAEEEEDDDDEYYCLKWLDKQPRESVIFVCLGSYGVLSNAQTEELAIGLEMSEQRFLWVVKCPNEKASLAYSQSDAVDPLDFLPQGFVERTRERGLVVPRWAPQKRVLSHAATGGFISHLGWNSTTESIANGVPLVAWPLHAEQKMNAVLVTQGVKVALRPKVGESGLVERQEIASVIKRLMMESSEEGKELRYRVKNLMEAAATALDENGSSTKLMSQLALKWNKGGKTTPSN